MPLVMALALGLLAAAPTAAAGPGGTVTIELFTSQGCSSCPPSDELFDRLWRAGDLGEDVVVLAWHVDYWNRLGWPDPFSIPDASERQRFYAGKLGLRQVYTPMMVLNGASAAVTPGSRERVLQALEDARQAPVGTLEVAARAPLAAGSSLDVEVAARVDRRAPAARLEVQVVVFDSQHRTPVPRGENSGRTLADSWVVRAWRKAMDLSPIPEARVRRRLQIPLGTGWAREHLGVAALLVDPATGRVLQARRAAVPARP